MKKYFLTLAVALVALSASAQRASSSSSSFFSTEKANQPITYGIRGGLNVASMSNSGGPDLKSKVGFNLGVAVDIPILESFYVQSGLYYTMKGYKYELDMSTSQGQYWASTEVKATMGYLEIPVLASYRYNFDEKNQLQFDFGPYFAYGLHGKAKNETSSNTGYSHKEDIDVFDEGNGKRFDMGLQVGAGITIEKHYYVGLAYEFGLVSVEKDRKAKNRNFMVNVGYQF